MLLAQLGPVPRRSAQASTHCCCRYTPPREGKKASGYDRAVKRLQYAAEEKERRQAEAEAEAAKKAALAFAMKPPKPFTFQTAKRAERRTPLLYMDVNLGPGKTGRIGLHQDDDPVQLAGNFARAYQLDATMRDRLQQLIERYMAEIVPGLAAQVRHVPGRNAPASVL